ncbi:putative zinc knuckle (CCHC-type) family protein [Trifolium pratense]|uniref:Putative zinc knuckle (CCHC-type) family protein n=1 Tax=Trifolium pratense TaxID=57577 RepID=A0A2K3P581_TRIPR|nr:putative zinc knuckle (CCHC-type) family protein [Trifolium pratense]
MCQTSQQQTTIPHSPSPQFQFHPSTPEKSTHFSPPPSLLQRMQRDKCFSCNQIGHWTQNCPNKTPNNNNSKKPDSANQQIWCRCGYGVCGSKQSGTAKNYGRWYFTCPIERGARCNWVKWCDEHILESDLRPPLLKYPLCDCGAGVCRRVVETGQCCYFACPIKKSHGSCGYRVLEYELLNKARNDEPVNNTSVVPIQQSRHRDLNEFFEGDQTDTSVINLDNDMAEGSDLLSKRMRLTDGSENSSPVAVSEIPEGKCGGSPIEVVVISDIPEGKCGGSPIVMANSQPVDFPEIKFEDDDLETINLASWDAIDAEARLSFSTPSRISCRQSVFQKDILSADVSFGINSQSECRDVVIKSPNQGTQLSPGSEVKLKGFLIEAQKRLLDDLENLDFDQYESMRVTAEATFFLLNCSGFQCKQFSDYVWDFINLATSLAEIDKSMENSPTLEEYSKLLEEERVKLANIKDECTKTEALLQSSNQKRKFLSEEVSRLEAVLREKQNELKFCDLETVKFETRLGDVKRRMLEADETVEDRILQTEAARIKVKERDTKEIAARIALKNAKHALEN